MIRFIGIVLVILTLTAGCYLFPGEERYLGKVAVSFEAEGFDSGDTPETIYADSNEEITVPGNTGGLIKYEHAFSRWEKKGNGSVYLPDETLNVGTEGITLVAVFEEMDVPDEKKDDIIEKLNEHRFSLTY